MALLTVPAPCQDPPASALPSPLGLREAIRMAWERNPAVRAAGNGVEIAEALRLDASKRLNPAISFMSENWRAFSPDQGPFFQTQDITTRFDYELETGGRRELRTREASLAVETAQASLEDRRRLLALEVQRVYFRAVLAQSNLELAGGILEEINRLIGLNQVRYTNGEISGGELKRSELERLRFLDDVLASELALRNAKSELLALLGFSQLDHDFQLAETLPVDAARPAGLASLAALVSNGELQERAMRQRPDLQAALREEQRADTETLRQRAIRSPNVTLGGGYKRAGPFNSLIFGVTVPLKIFNRNEGGIARAEAELARARNQAALTRTALLLDVQKASHAVRINQQRVRYIESEYLNRAEESRRIASVSYRLGETSLTDLLDTERVYRETRRIYHQALYDYRISLYELAAAVGEEFP